ncbi:unnamed protein product [Trichobilharzia regenti]|nr:unnamed protein product [Trichobilharzia regenti]
MAPLPDCRLKAHVPSFTSVGVNYFGPFFTKRGRVVRKRYGCLFTCLSIRAVHIEMAHTSDTDSFLCASSRFAARRGYPERIFSDNGSNFKGADASLKQIIRSWDKTKIANNLLEKGCEWDFNPPSTSHRGGVWERVIRSVRKILRTLLFQKVLTDETLETFLVESEGILNSRLLVRFTGYGDELSVLTPNKLLLLHKQLMFDGIEASRTSLYNKRWEEGQHLTDLFWHRWLSEYLPMLQTRSKWLDIKCKLQPGDLVLVNSLWPKATVKQVYYDQSGRVRTVRLKTATEEVKRNIRSICLLEEADNLKVPDTRSQRGGRPRGMLIATDRWIV